MAKDLNQEAAGHVFSSEAAIGHMGVLTTFK